MGLNDGFTDRQSHSRAFFFRCHQGVKDSLKLIRIDARAIVRQAKHYLIVIIEGRIDRYPPVRLLRPLHRLHGISDQVNQQLLELDPVCVYIRKLYGKICVDGHILINELAVQNSQGVHS